MQIRAIQANEAPAWDEYVNRHPQATLYHLYGWRNVIEKTYGHQTYYLTAIKERDSQYPIPNTHLVGVLPLVHLKSLFFGNSLISMPYVDLGGILADDDEIGQDLLTRAIKLGQKLKAHTIELRHSHLPSRLNSTNCVPVVSRSHKVRMLLDLPDHSEALMKSFKAKLRNQIKKPMKEGLFAKVGSEELLKDFYTVFSKNMRDLGSPVHSEKIVRHVLAEFPNQARIVVVYRDKQPMACSLTIGFNEVLENPWASALREYSRLSPNMLLYWTMLEYACNNAFARFDFGRSTPGEGTYKFKKQWGAKPNPLHWHYISLNDHQLADAPDDKSRFEPLIKYWQKMPVPVTRAIGPMIRKHIGL
ncbi:MAG: FemAB family XrtA/PEP-CTERM system-associated protein [Deltaproteobacteria bacterium]|nr:FemAB family XrtA/PEP-CTERM system-associated protein [Deltaproteobacteria bacterium]